MQKKKIVALALAGLMSFGAASVSMMPATEAAHHAEEHYADGTSNEYSHRMEQENKQHEQTVREIRTAYRIDGDKKKYERELKKEQKRHDREVAGIKADSEAHVRHTKHHHN